MSDKLDNILTRLLQLETALDERVSKVEAAVGIKPRVEDDALDDDRRPRKPAAQRYGMTRGPPDDLGDRRLPTGAVAARYEVSTRSIERWCADPELGFPQPLYVNDRKYWSLAELDAWDRARLRISLKRAKAPPQRRREVAA
jgi:hypothetical protein